MERASRHPVTIWTASTGQALGLTSAACLDEEELRKAYLFKQPDDRDRFLAARALLRHALSELMDGEIDPETWNYIEGANGKPLMAPDLPLLEFNMSHAGDCVVVAVSPSGPVGVDVESTLRDERLEIVDDVLTGQERAHLARLPDDRQWKAFVEFWTLKEACAKALGLGATLDFGKLEVLLKPLRVVAPQGLLGPGETFDIETQEVFLYEKPYRLSTAHITVEPGETEFRFKSLPDDHIVT